MPNASASLVLRKRKRRSRVRPRDSARTSVPPGQLLETVPGFIVTLHSGEGKANQYLTRGYNLDHGTDLATLVEGIPIDQPTHAHGQGYTDRNFLIPELAERISYTKGPRESLAAAVIYSAP